MKILAFALMTLASVSVSVSAQTELSHNALVALVSRNTTEIIVKVDASSVRCSNLGYSRPELKVDVPALDWAATFNHRTFGEGQPCMTSIECKTYLEPAELIAAGTGDISAPLTVVHTERAWINEAEGTCSRWLQEDLEMTLNGVVFRHQRTGNLGDTTAQACKALFN